MTRVLIVEDEQHIADGLRYNLEAEGYRVEVAESGEAALELLLPPHGQTGAQPPAFDAVVLDVMLPGKDGFSVISELRRAGQFVPTLMLTARGRPEDVLKGFEAGADDYLPKPFDLGILIARLQGLLLRREWLSSSICACRAGTNVLVQRPDSGFRPAGVDRRQSGFPADADGGEPAAIPRQARGQAGFSKDDAGGGVGVEGRHRYAGHRQLHPQAEALYRRGAGAPAPSADGAQRRLLLRGQPARASREVDYATSTGAAEG